MENPWIRLEDLKITSDTNLINVDTRDWRCHPWIEEVTSTPSNPPQESLISESHLPEWLLELKGIFYRRHLILRFSGIPGWTKYLRIYRYDGENFLVCDRSGVPIDWRTEIKEDKLL